MPLELTLHPETGELVEVVHSYEKRSVDDFRNDVTAKEQALAEARTRREAKQEELQTVAEEEGRAEAALQDSKSVLQRASELVGNPDPGVDAGAENASGPVENEEAVGANF
jgi:exonuclease VII large subunit